MTLSLLHTTQSAKPQSADTSLISKNAWNEEHTLTAAGLSVLARVSATTGAVSDLVAAADNYILQRSGASLVFAALALTSIPDDLITYAKIQNVSATNRVLGRITAGAGDIEELTAANVKTILGFPTTSVDNAAIRADGTSGGMQTSLVTIDDTGLITTPGGVFSGAALTTQFLFDNRTPTTSQANVMLGGRTYLGAAADILTMTGYGELQLGVSQDKGATEFYFDMLEASELQQYKELFSDGVLPPSFRMAEVGGAQPAPSIVLPAQIELATSAITNEGWEILLPAIRLSTGNIFRMLQRFIALSTGNQRVEIGLKDKTDSTKFICWLLNETTGSAGVWQIQYSDGAITTTVTPNNPFIGGSITNDPTARWKLGFSGENTATPGPISALAGIPSLDPLVNGVVRVAATITTSGGAPLPATSVNLCPYFRVITKTTAAKNFRFCGYAQGRMQ